MHVVAALGFNGDDAFWYVVAGGLVAVGSALVYSARRAIRWFGQRLKENFKEWFAEAVDEHVAPQIAAIFEQLDSHVSHDDRVMAAAGEALVRGQSELQRQMQDHHDESMAMITQHVESDEAAFARIETKLGTEGAP